MNLCCQVNPCYTCEACGFKECWDHWNEKKWKVDWADFHFKPPYIPKAAVCRVTNKKLKIVEDDHITVYKLA